MAAPLVCQDPGHSLAPPWEPSFARNLNLPAANIRDSKAAQRAGVCASKSEDLGSIPRTHGVSRESQLLQIVF